MYDTLHIQKKIQDKTCTLFVSGVLDYSTMGPFNDEIKSIGGQTKIVIVDFSKLKFIDSTGIGAIVNLVYEATEKDFEVKLEGINEDINELFKTIGVYKIMESLLGSR